MTYLELYLYCNFYFSAAELPPPLTPIKLTPSPNITLTPEEMASKTINRNLLCRKRLFINEAGDVPGVQQLAEHLENLRVEDLGHSRVSLNEYYDDEP